MQDNSYSKNSWLREAIIYREYQFQPDFPIFVITTNGRPTQKSHFHFHNSLELGYFIKGELNWDIEGHRYICSEGDLLFVPPFYTHSCEPVIPESEVSIHYIYLNPEELLRPFYPYGIPPSILWYKNHNFSGVIPSSDSPQLAQLILHLVYELKNPSPSAKVIVAAFVQTLLIFLSRYFLNLNQVPDQHNHWMAQIYPALNYINTNYASPITAEFLAELCCMSTELFRKKFNETFFASPSQYLKMIRIQNACDLLHETEQSIADISLSVGFSSLSCFYQFFTRYLHITPSAYRKEYCTYQKKNLKHKPWNSGSGGSVMMPPSLSSTNTRR